MKEIKAYIRRDKAAAVVEALDRAGAPEITLIEVHAIGFGDEPNYFAREDELFTRYSNVMVKAEVVCAESDADRLVTALRAAAHTGFRGDGLILVSEVRHAVRVINGASGDAALQRVAPP